MRLLEATNGRPVTLEITDTGIGILPSNEIPFSKPSPKPNPEPVAVIKVPAWGLRFPERSVPQLGYEIEVESRASGGSLFRILVNETEALAPTAD